MSRNQMGSYLPNGSVSADEPITVSFFGGLNECLLHLPCNLLITTNYMAFKQVQTSDMKCFPPYSDLTAGPACCILISYLTSPSYTWHRQLPTDFVGGNNILFFSVRRTYLSSRLSQLDCGQDRNVWCSPPVRRWCPPRPALILRHHVHHVQHVVPQYQS